MRLLQRIRDRIGRWALEPEPGMFGSRILVISDDDRVGRLVEVNLQQQGYAVTSVDSADSALRWIAESAPDLMVLDMETPGFDSLMRELKKSSGNPGIPLILLSPSAKTHDVVGWGGEGYDGILTKPFNPMELISFVKRILQSAEDVSERHMRIWDPF